MSKKDEILRATVRLVQEEGVSQVTTKKIAAAAGCAEGTIFRHFGDKGALLANVLSFGLPELQAFADAGFAGGRQPLPDGLAALCASLRDFYCASYPLVASAIADKSLFEGYSAAHRKADTGPQQPWRHVHHFLLAERTAGSITADVDLQLEALLITGACQNIAFIELVSGPSALPHAGDHLVERLAHARSSALQEP